ncbi:pilus assembly PilX family protein [Paraherbaspirillum soli]|uniref:PilX N-terminal domain-containing pilus assembly protein n=1 Tax=Paraherbaspirillum soli TaxID=631222 RepID=A0ABW0M5E0_9BURK
MNGPNSLMTSCHLAQSRRRSIAQSGIALPIVLIFLVVMMLLGVSAIRNVVTEEKMAGNARSQHLAFQAAEQALRVCEKWAQLEPGRVLQEGPAPGWPTNGENYWEFGGGRGWETTHYTGGGAPVAENGLFSYEVPLANPELAKNPRCMMERLALVERGEFTLKPPESRPAYRITARAFGSNDNTVVMLQSYLIP